MKFHFSVIVSDALHKTALRAAVITVISDVKLHEFASMKIS